MEIVEQVYQLLKSYDRLPSNPDDEFLRETIAKQLGKEGRIRLMVLVCPRLDYLALRGDKPEEFFPTGWRQDGFFLPRLPKLKELRIALQGMVATEFVYLIGDEDVESYKWPLLEGIGLDKEGLNKRKDAYRQSIIKLITERVGGSATILSLSELGVEPDTVEPQIGTEEFGLELGFFAERFSPTGTYGGFGVGPELLKKMARKKFQTYGAQGRLLEDLGGILLQTEGGPSRWRLETELFRCTGAQAIPAIYPWIRSEELEEIKVS